jgi:large subunit ribosomal protein L29
LKAKEFREMTTEQLKEREIELGESILNLRIQATTGALDNVHAIRTARRDIARIKTILREAELANEREAK